MEIERVFPEQEQAIKMPILQLDRSNYYLKQVGKDLQNPEEIVKVADNFFFDEEGFRKVSSLDDTTEMVATLMEQGLYKPYVQSRSLFTIPTTEFIEKIADVLEELNPQQILEAGAGDGTLAHNLQHKFPNLVAVDDQYYGRNYLREKRDFRYDGRPSIYGRPVYPIVENRTVQEALAEYGPDCAIASWYVTLDNKGDDIELFNNPSIQSVLWIGDKEGRTTSTHFEEGDIWRRKDYTKIPLSQIADHHFSLHDGSNYDEFSPSHQAFPVDMSLQEKRQKMRREGEVILFIRNS